MDERWDKLPGTEIEILQSREVFSFGLDAVLLAHFPRVPKSGKIVDLCSGNGAVGLMLSALTTGKLALVELQPRLSEMAARSVSRNGLATRVTPLTLDLKDAPAVLGANSQDLVVCNPPYFKVENQSQLKQSEYHQLARHELTTDFETICKSAQTLLKGQGHFALIHRPARFFELTETLLAHHLVPKRIRFVYPKMGAAANLVLIDAIKDGHAGGEIFEPPLVIYQENGAYTDDVQEIYFGKT
ncbi:MAG: tRNA1(Val) (adenine(37)-N6)-methyltransferase [Streptococcaceae bacterium]|jgi:tRNA1(Val) A37 N6-methylase TrmN6|nr:tRNA1(Val) (adenine(37)-N6)-methyltransferase [Streptococcaceae bacterium]